MSKLSLNKTLASSVALLLATSAFAIPRGPCDPKPMEVCCEEPRPGPFAFSYPKDVGLSCPRDFYFQAQLLVMQAKEDGLEYGITDTNGGGFPVSGGNVQDFSRDNHDWDYNLGFRFGFGFYLTHDVWNLDINWTYLNITEHTTSHVRGSGVLIPLWFMPPTNPVASNNLGSARWKAHYSMFDLHLGKPYHISRYVVFNPHFGLRGGWIDQHYTAQYSGLFAGVEHAEMTAKNDFWGVGLRAGLDTEWLLGAGWNLFGNVSASMLFAKFDISQEWVAGTAGGTHNNELDDVFYQNTPNFELALGINWGYFFCKNRYHFSLSLAYEFIHWWDQNRMRRWWDSTASSSNDTVSRGDLSLNGISFKVAFDF